MYRIRVLVVFLFVVISSSLTFSQDVFPSRYHTYQEVLDTLVDLGSSYSNIMYIDTLGYSTRDSIPMLRVKISDNPTIDEDEPVVFFCGGVHADEVLSVEVPLNFIQDILYQYSMEVPEVIYLIGNLEIYVIPFINPEGHLVVEGGDLDWRKNKSDNDTNGVFNNYDGVDNNRNYDFGWSIDTQTDPANLMFKGYAPFTESENLAMRDFAWKYRPLIALDYHSPTYGRPNVAYYPWYWYANVGGHGMSPDENFMQSICESFTSLILAIPDDSNTVTYTARRALVNKGDFKTYFYGNFGTVSFSVEISDTTIQDTTLVDSIVTAHLPGQYYLLNRAMGAGITGVIRDSVTLEPIEAEVQVLQHINSDINPRLSRPDFGRYRRLLAPGTYTLKFLKTGYRDKTVFNVSVSSGGPTTTDILLYPFNPRPPAPELYYPVASDTIVEDTFTFDWSDPVYSDIFLLEVSIDPDFVSFVILDSSLTVSECEISSPLEEGIYYWRVKAGNSNGWGPYSEVNNFYMDDQTFIALDSNLPSGFKLYQNHPNPFNSSTRIRFDLQHELKVVIEIFDITGSLVARLSDRRLPAGSHTVTWDGTDLYGNPVASGLYLYRMSNLTGASVRKMLLLK